MKDAILQYLAPREEEIEFAGVKLRVRELETASESEAMRNSKDAVYHLIVLCVLDAEGNRVFSEQDIPALKASSQQKMLPLIAAVHRVMGLSTEDEVKNSDAAPSGG